MRWERLVQQWPEHPWLAAIMTVAFFLCVLFASLYGHAKETLDGYYPKLHALWVWQQEQGAQLGELQAEVHRVFADLRNGQRPGIPEYPTTRGWRRREVLRERRVPLKRVPAPPPVSSAE